MYVLLYCTLYYEHTCVILDVLNQVLTLYVLLFIFVTFIVTDGDATLCCPEGGERYSF